jgi:hypothetical protein
VSRLTPRLRDALAESGFVTEVQSDEVELHPELLLMLKAAGRRSSEGSMRECLEMLAAVRGGYSVGEWEADGRKQRIIVVLGNGAGQGAEVLRA